VGTDLTFSLFPRRFSLRSRLAMAGLPDSRRPDSSPPLASIVKGGDHVQVAVAVKVIVHVAVNRCVYGHGWDRQRCVGGLLCDGETAACSLVEGRCAAFG